MATPINAAPYTQFLGIDDESTRAQTVAAQAVPTHLPLHPLYAPWGPEDAVIVDSGALTSLFGADVLNPRGAHYTTQSLFAQTIQSKGNQVMVKRLLPADVGPKSRLLLSLEIVDDNIQQYTRNSDGSFKRNGEGGKIPVTGVGATLQGYKARWVLNDWITSSETGPELFGEVAERGGDLASTIGDSQSTIYPILELEGTFFGALGNNLGIRLVAPTSEDPSPANTAQADRLGSFLYRLQMVRRNGPLSSASITKTQSGEQWVDFSLKEGAFDPNTDLSWDLSEVLTRSYSDHGNPGFAPVYGPFENIHVYRNNLEQVLDKIAQSERPLGLLPEAMDVVTTGISSDVYTVNPFTAVNYDGVPYYTLEMHGPEDGGLIFTPNSTFYATGASDGTMTPETFDADVRTFAENFDLLDMAKYPFSFLYDSGFSLPTKYALASILGKRPDVNFVTSTQSILDPQNTADEDSSMAMSLAAYIGNTPESTVYGTPACRAMIVGSSGHLLNSNYRGLVPLTLQVAARFAAYMGAANGRWDTSVPPDEYPYNVVNMFRDVNAAFKPAAARSKDWTTGLVWIENFDTDTQYFPALASVYSNDTSILKSFINVAIATDLIKIAHQVRRELSGISSLTDAQFVQRSNQRINALVKGRYGGRVAVSPDTYYTAGDVANGYSWHCDITMYGNNMRTVGSDTIIARRMSDLSSQANG